MNTTLARIAVALTLLATGAGVRAGATVRIQQEALVRAYPAANCSYCHTFDSDHMVRRAAREGLKVRSLECRMCHGAHLRTGPRVLNARGLWLLERKQRLGTARVDVFWLAEYPEPAPPDPRPRRAPPAKRVP
jgi:cytochrome c5